MPKEKNTTEKNYKLISKSEANKKLGLEIELDFQKLESKKTKAVKKLGSEIEIKGFRKGNAPEHVLMEHLDQSRILEEMAYQAIVEVLPEIIEGEKINALTQPNISITKMATGNPLIFKADFILMPEIELADYRKIVSSIKPVSTKESEVTEDEVKEYIDYILNSKAEADALKRKTSAIKEVREEAIKNKNEKIVLPEFNDEFVKQLGNFENVEDFKKQLKENMSRDKDVKMKQKRRLEIIEKIIAESKIEIPDIMIEEELSRMMEQFKADLQQAKIEVDEYLKQIKKSQDDLMKEWRPDAVKRTKMNLILPKIAFEEKIEPDEKLVASEVEHLRKHYPEMTSEHAKNYVSYMLRNDEVFKFLENL